MEIFEYLKPDNPIAQQIVYVLTGLFAFWLCLLLWSLVQGLRYLGQIKRCKDTSLLVRTLIAPRAGGGGSPEEGEKVFRAFLDARGLKARSPIAMHLRAVFDAGWNESQLDAGSLIRSTVNRLLRAGSLHRALLSIFIVLGLLGTLFGLADTLASLDTLLRGSARLDNNALNQGLRTLLGNLKGAFAPSILGVLLTVSGVLFFAFYLRYVAQPLGNALERMTLTVWIPQLVRTSSQKLLDKLQLSERQMQRSFAAAQQVAEFAENIQHKTGAFGEALGSSTESLKRMSQTSTRLETFSEKFVEGVQALTPFQQDLRKLYQQMVEESRAFQESVRRNIAGAEDFQQRIREQLDGQHQQLEKVLAALDSYEKAYVASRGRIDEKLVAVLDKAEKAFHHLGRRNDEIGRALDESLGRPLRENLASNLGAVETALQTRLGEVEKTLEVRLSNLGERLRELDAPLNSAAKTFTETFYNFNEHTNEWRTSLQREFAAQNETSQGQLRRLETLSEQIPELLQRLSASSDNFSESSSAFVAQGRQLSQDVESLSRHIGALSQSIDALDKRFESPRHGDDGQVLGLLTQQTNALHVLTKRLERLTPGRRQGEDGSHNGGPKPGWWKRFKNRLASIGGR